MSTRKPQLTDKVQAAEGRDDLALDAETVKDLEPAEGAARVRGGAGTHLCNGSITQRSGGGGSGTG